MTDYRYQAPKKSNRRSDYGSEPEKSNRKSDFGYEPEKSNRRASSGYESDTLTRRSGYGSGRRSGQTQARNNVRFSSKNMIFWFDHTFRDKIWERIELSSLNVMK